MNLGVSFLAGSAGGYVTAWIAAANTLIHVLALALIVLALAALSALQSPRQQPVWYYLAQVAFSPVGVFAGGLVRLRVWVFYSGCRSAIFGDFLRQHTSGDCYNRPVSFPYKLSRQKG